MDHRIRPGVAGKVAVVTGASRGIGEAIARAFVAEGTRVVSLDLAVPAAAVDGVRSIEADVSDRASVARAFADVEAVEGRCDILVNNAGIQRVGLTETFDPAEWERVVAVHLFGMYHCTALALPMMRRAGGGAIVSLASGVGLVGVPGRGPYSAAKGGIISLTRSLAVELASVGIRVNAVAPGYTMTPLIAQGIADGSIREDELVREIPMRRLATPEEIARVVRFLAGDEASYITGQAIVVDGGWTIQGLHDRPAWLDPASLDATASDPASLDATMGDPASPDRDPGDSASDPASLDGPGEGTADGPRA